MANSAWRFIRAEPLVHFLAVAAVLFVANAYFSGDDRELVEVDYRTQQYLITQRQELLLRPLTDDEKALIIQDFVEEEILLREARKRGFDNSSRIRTLLIQNMRFFLANDVAEPTEAELLEFFNANLDRFETSPRISYDHVVFDDANAVPAETLRLLNAGADHTSMGNVKTFGSSRLLRVDERSIIATFGAVVAPDVLAIADGDWHGPFESAQGVHFLRVIERHPSIRPRFEDARSWVESEWNRMQQREIIDRELATMREGYRIEIAAPEDQ